MMKAKGLPGYLWGEVVNTAVYLLNRSPMRSLEGMTPYEAWHEKKPNLAHLRTFDSLVYIKSTKPHLKKLDDSNTKMVFVSYEARYSSAMRPGTRRTARAPSMYKSPEMSC
jgi:hypothetical protein